MKIMLICLSLSLPIYAAEPNTNLNPNPIVDYGDHLGKDFEFWHLSSATLTPEGILYLVDKKQKCILKYDMAGNFLNKFGRQGEGPGEFEDPTDAIYVIDELWVADYKNLRIQIFKDDKYDRMIKTQKPTSVKHMVSNNDTVFVTDHYYLNDLGSILKLNLEGEIIGRINSIDVPNPRSMQFAPLWRGYELLVLEDKSFVLGYNYDHLIVKASSKGETLKAISMEDYYEATTEGTPPMVAPGSQLVSAFAAGPNNTVLMTICDHTVTRNDCSILYQFNPDLSKILNRWNMKEYIRFMKYDRDKGLLITGTQTELKIYEME